MPFPSAVVPRLFAALLPALAACSPTLKTECSSDDDCAGGERCFAGRCAVYGPADGRSGDAGTADARMADARAGDARTGDARMADARTGDARTADARTGDAQAGDAQTGDATLRADLGADALAPPADARATPPDAQGPGVDARGPAVDALVGPLDAQTPVPDRPRLLADVASPGPDALGPTPDAAEPTPDAALPGPDGLAPALDLGGPTPDACLPEPEVCDGLDNDCDGRADEGEVAFVGSLCHVGTGQCDREGTLICTPERGLVCSASPGVPQPEICNERDDDCDGSTDEGFDLGSLCIEGVGGCAAAGIRICSPDGLTECSAVASPPGQETCDGTDQDCNGQIDDVPGLGQACVSGLGACAAAGVLLCTNGGAPVCSGVARPAEEERCDNADHDCNGIIADVPVAQLAVGVPYLNFNVLDPLCTGGGGELAGPNCNAAIHLYCASQRCWASGFGPVFADPQAAEVVCLRDGATEFETTVIQLRGIEAGCNSSLVLGGIDCNAAIDETCVRDGFAGGYGPVRKDANQELAYVCLGAPQVVTRELVPWNEMVGRHPGCHGQTPAAQSGGPCLYAANESCLARRYYAGYGPVQADAMGATVLCLSR